MRKRLNAIVQWIDGLVVRPSMRQLLLFGLAPQAFALVQTTGRRTGQPRLTPVGNGRVGDTFWLVAGMGETADYVKNLRRDPAVRVKIGRRWYDGTASTLPDDDTEARVAFVLSHFGLLRRLDAKLLELSVWLAGTRPLTVRIDLSGPGRLQGSGRRQS